MRQTLSLNILNALSHGKAQLSEEAQRRIQAFIRSQQLEDGSFMDKNGCPDVYYTTFGWLLCYVFGLSIPRKAALHYLKSIQTENLDLVHYAAYTRCQLLYRLLTRHPLHTWLLIKGFHLHKKDAIPFIEMESLSPYSLFIRLSLLEDAGKRIQNKEEWLQTLCTYRTMEGGYSNLKGSSDTEASTRSCATVNATAAALCVLGQLKSDEAGATAEFLLSRQHPNGGFSASTDAPLPDLLSTATALFALHANGRQPNPAAREFVEAHWNETSGGFSATLFDETSDIEYTFYGLLALGTL